MNKLNFIFLATLVSCGIGGAKGPLQFAIKVDEPIRSEEVDFALLQKKILPKCIGCHETWTTEEAFAKYIKPGRPDESLFYDSVKTGRMPKRSPPLSTAQLEIVRSYILYVKVVAPTPVPETTPEPTPVPVVNFQDLQEKVFTVSCLPCHTKILNDENLLNGNWVNKTSPELSKLLVETEAGRMPKGGAPLSSEQLQLIRDYVNKFRE